MRIFLAIAFDEGVKGYIDGITNSLESKVRGSYVKRQNLHLTLKFLGELTNTKLQAVEKAVYNTACKCSPFSLITSYCGAFRGMDGNTLWLGLNKEEKLNKLFELLEENLSAEDFPKDSRTFSPHITLARRAKEKIPEDFKLRTPINIAVDGITIFESLRIGNDLVYKPLLFADFPSKLAHQN